MGDQALDQEIAEGVASLQIQAEERPSVYNLPEEIVKYIMTFTDEAQKIRELESKIAKHVNNMIFNVVDHAARQRHPHLRTDYDNYQLAAGFGLPQRTPMVAIRRLALIDGQELPAAIDRWEAVYDTLRRRTRTPFR
jgi:hypothetical protein